MSMQRLHARLLILLAAGLPSAAICQSPNKTISVRSDDAEMNAAIAKARTTLPIFYRHWMHPGQKEAMFSLKVKIEDAGNVEHFWLVDLKGRPGHLSGVVNNDPDFVHTVSLGQRIPISVNKISDWMYVRKGKIVGNQTARVLIRRMSPAERKEAQKMFEHP